MGNRRSTLALAIVGALALALGAHCGNNPGPNEGDPESCADACARLAELECPEAEPTPEGASCVEVCENVEGSGTVTLNPACVIGITACAQVDACVEFGEPGAGGASGAAGAAGAAS